MRHALQIQLLRLTVPLDARSADGWQAPGITEEQNYVLGAFLSCSRTCGQAENKDETSYFHKLCVSAHISIRRGMSAAKPQAVSFNRSAHSVIRREVSRRAGYAGRRHPAKSFKVPDRYV